MEESEIKKNVREGYAKVAKENSSCCGPSSSESAGSCGCGPSIDQESVSKAMGYSKEELESLPEGADLGLGCGNPTALASIKEGETVIDLGSGAGIDCFLAAKKVGKNGKVIGVDMTPEMLDKARANAKDGNIENVEFRLGEIDNLPVADNTADLIISNCVINLAPDKKKVFEEAFRVLKPGGRVMISDIVLLGELSDALKASKEAYVGCISGAIPREDYLQTIKDAGFEKVEVVSEATFPVEDVIVGENAQKILKDADLTTKEAIKAAIKVSSVKVKAYKPS
jgi:SAM-dependent methyltransferase